MVLQTALNKYLPDDLLTVGKSRKDVDLNPHIIAPDPYASENEINELLPLLFDEEGSKMMNPSHDDSTTGVNARLRPRKPSVPNERRNKVIRKLDRIADAKTKKDYNVPKTPQEPATTDKSDSHLLCLYCDKKFPQKQSLSKHIRRVHFNTADQVYSITCNFCSHSEPENSRIIKHMIDCHPNHYFACLSCQTRFNSTTELATHKLTFCEKQKHLSVKPYRSKLRQKSASSTKKHEKSNLAQEKDKISPTEAGFNGIVISCELKPSQLKDAADIEDNITTNLILPPCKSLVTNSGLEKNAVIVLDDIQWNKRIGSNLAFHSTDTDQILSRLGIVHRSPRTSESTKRDWYKHADDPTKFEKCFDTNFYTRVASNVQENLNKFLDGSFNRFPSDTEHVIKTRKAKNSVIINTVEGFPILLAAEQYSRNAFDSYMPRAVAPKHKWKWDNVENDNIRQVLNQDREKRDSHDNNCIITLVSSLDIWTQLCMRRKYEAKFNSSVSENKKTEKQNAISKELKEIIESREIPTTSTQVVKFTTNRPAKPANNLDFPASLGLVPTAPKYDLQPAVLSGEWVRPRCYVCCACGEQTQDSKALSAHISNQHPNAQIGHYEIVGEPLLNADILKHLYVPPSQSFNRTRPLRGSRECTKCKKAITLDDLHEHMLECAGDTPVVRRKCRYRPFGVRRRRPRLPDNRIRKQIRKDIRNRQNRQKNHIRPRNRIRTEVGDAETIRKMLADLPAKRHRVTINPMNSILRPKKKHDKQRQLLMKRRMTENPKNKNDKKKLNKTVASGNEQASTSREMSYKETTLQSSLQSARTKRRTIVKKTIRKVHGQKIDNTKTESDAAESNSETIKSSSVSSGITTEDLSINSKSDKVSMNNAPNNTRECSNRNNSNSRDGWKSQDNEPSRGNLPQNTGPLQNAPLKHSIARLTSSDDNNDRYVKYHPHLLAHENFIRSVHNSIQYVPTGQHLFFENETAMSKLDKPPLIDMRKKSDICGLQKNKPNKPKKGLNDCIAMLKNKLVDTNENSDSDCTQKERIVSEETGTDSNDMNEYVTASLPASEMIPPAHTNMSVFMNAPLDLSGKNQRSINEVDLTKQTNNVSLDLSTKQIHIIQETCGTLDLSNKDITKNPDGSNRQSADNVHGSNDYEYYVRKDSTTINPDYSVQKLVENYGAINSDYYTRKTFENNNEVTINTEYSVRKSIDCNQGTIYSDFSKRRSLDSNHGTTNLDYSLIKSVDNIRETTNPNYTTKNIFDYNQEVINSDCSARKSVDNFQGTVNICTTRKTVDNKQGHKNPEYYTKKQATISPNYSTRKSSDNNQQTINSDYYVRKSLDNLKGTINPEYSTKQSIDSEQGIINSEYSVRKPVDSNQGMINPDYSIRKPLESNHRPTNPDYCAKKLFESNHGTINLDYSPRKSTDTDQRTINLDYPARKSLDSIQESINSSYSIRKSVDNYPQSSNSDYSKTTLQSFDSNRRTMSSDYAGRNSFDNNHGTTNFDYTAIKLVDNNQRTAEYSSRRSVDNNPVPINHYHSGRKSIDNQQDIIISTHSSHTSKKSADNNHDLINFDYSTPGTINSGYSTRRSVDNIKKIRSPDCPARKSIDNNQETISSDYSVRELINNNQGIVHHDYATLKSTDNKCNAISLECLSKTADDNNHFTTVTVSECSIGQSLNNEGILNIDYLTKKVTDENKDYSTKKSIDNTQAAVASDCIISKCVDYTENTVVNCVEKTTVSNPRQIKECDTLTLKSIDNTDENLKSVYSTRNTVDTNQEIMNSGCSPKTSADKNEDVVTKVSVVDYPGEINDNKIADDNKTSNTLSNLTLDLCVTTAQKSVAKDNLALTEKSIKDIAVSINIQDQTESNATSDILVKQSNDPNVKKTTETKRTIEKAISKQYQTKSIDKVTNQKPIYDPTLKIPQYKIRANTSTEGTDKDAENDQGLVSTDANIELLPKEIVDILGTMPVQHRNKLLNVLPQVFAKTVKQLKLAVDSNVTKESITSPNRNEIATQTSSNMPEQICPPEFVNVDTEKFLIDPVSGAITERNHNDVEITDNTSNSDKITDLVSEECQENMNLNTSKTVNIDSLLNITIQSEPKATIFPISAHSQQKSPNDQTASLRAVRIKTANVKQKTSKRESNLVPQKSVEKLEEVSNNVISEPVMTSDGMNSINVETSLAIQQSEVTSTQQNNLNYKSSLNPPKCPPLVTKEEVPYNSDTIMTKSSTSKSLSPALENKGEQVQESHVEIKGRCQMDKDIKKNKTNKQNISNLREVVDENLSKGLESYTPLVQSISLENIDIPLKSISLSTSIGNTTDVKDNINKSSLDKLDDDDSEDDISLATIIKQKQTTKGRQNINCLNTIKTISSTGTPSKTKKRRGKANIKKQEINIRKNKVDTDADIKVSKYRDSKTEPVKELSTQTKSKSNKKIEQAVQTIVIKDCSPRSQEIEFNMSKNKLRADNPITKTVEIENCQLKSIENIGLKVNIKPNEQVKEQALSKISTQPLATNHKENSEAKEIVSNKLLDTNTATNKNNLKEKLPSEHFVEVTNQVIVEEMSNFNNYNDKSMADNSVSSNQNHSTNIIKPPVNESFVTEFENTVRVKDIHNTSVVDSKSILGQSARQNILGSILDTTKCKVNTMENLDVSAKYELFDEKDSHTDFKNAKDSIYKSTDNSVHKNQHTIDEIIGFRDHVYKPLLVQSGSSNRDQNLNADNSSIANVENTEFSESINVTQNSRDLFISNQIVNIPTSEETNNLYLRRSKRGKSLYVDNNRGNIDEYAFTENPYLQYKTPMPKKQLIFSKLLLDEENLSKPRMHIPSNLKTDVNTNEDCQDSTEVDIFKSKLSKRRMSPIVKKKNKKKKTLEEITKICSTNENLKIIPYAEDNVLLSKNAIANEVSLNIITTKEDQFIDSQLDMSDNTDLISNLTATHNNIPVEQHDKCRQLESSQNVDQNVKVRNQDYKSNKKKRKQNKNKLLCAEITTQNIENSSLDNTVCQDTNRDDIPARNDIPARESTVKLDHYHQSTSFSGINLEQQISENNNKPVGSVEKRKISECVSKIPFNIYAKKSKLTKKQENNSFATHSTSQIKESPELEAVNICSEKDNTSVPVSLDEQQIPEISTLPAHRTTRLKSVITTLHKDVPSDTELENFKDITEKSTLYNHNINRVLTDTSVDKFALDLQNKNRIGTKKSKKSKMCKAIPSTSKDNYFDLDYNSKDNGADSDDSLKSDVPLKKYAEEMAKSGNEISLNEPSVSTAGNTYNDVKNTSLDNKSCEKSLIDSNNIEHVPNNNTEEELRSEQFMESFGFFSERKPRKSNLLATKKISETFHIIANESDDLFFGAKDKSSKKVHPNENKKTNTQAADEDTNLKISQSVASKKLQKKGHKKKKEGTKLSQPTYCSICQKEFRRPDNFLRHQMTLYHISKVSEIEMKFETVPYREEPNYLIPYKQHLDKLKRLKEKLENEKKKKRRRTPPKPCTLPALAKKKLNFTQNISRRGLSRDEALFLDCCELLKSHKTNKTCTVTSSSIEGGGEALPEPCASTSNLNDDKSLPEGEGDIDSITANNILESEEVRNLENDLITGLKEAVSKSVSSISTEPLLISEEFSSNIVDVDECNKNICSQKTVELRYSHLEEIVETVTEKKLREATSKRKREIKTLAKIDTVDIFEDKFDIIKRKCRSQAAAAKNIQSTVEVQKSCLGRKKSEKKVKNKKSSKKNVQSTVLTKGALKEFDGIRVSIPTSDINISAIVPSLSDSEKQSKKRKKNGSKKKKDKGNLNLCSSLSFSDPAHSKDIPSTSKQIDVYEFMDNEDTDMFDFRTSKRLDRFKSTNKDFSHAHSSKTDPIILKDCQETQLSSVSGSDGDDFVYMSDDYMCSADETENSLMSCELGKAPSEGKKSGSSIKKKDSIEKNAMMGKIFKHNAMRNDKKNSPKAKETKSAKANLDQLFDSLLENEPNPSILNDSAAPKRNTPEKDLFDEGAGPSSAIEELEQEQPQAAAAAAVAVAEDEAGVARQRARRKCTVGKQNVLAESWSSESEGEVGGARCNSAESTAGGASGASGPGRRRRNKRGQQGAARRARHITFKADDNESRVSCSVSSPSVSARRDKRSRSELAYYWSSAEEEESHALVEQHGWIVGDSHKKLVTMLAHAKGRKRDDRRHFVE